MIEKILSKLFPPSVRSLGRMRIIEPEGFDEQGWAGNVKEHYRDGIQRVFAEQEEE